MDAQLFIAETAHRRNRVAARLPGATLSAWRDAGVLQAAARQALGASGGRALPVIDGDGGSLDLLRRALAPLGTAAPAAAVLAADRPVGRCGRCCSGSGCWAMSGEGTAEETSVVSGGRQARVAAVLLGLLLPAVALTPALALAQTPAAPREPAPELPPPPAVALPAVAPAAAASAAAEPAPAEQAPRFHSVVEAAALDGGPLAGAHRELGQEELRRRGATTLAEALRSEPGVRVSVSPVAGSANAKQERLVSLRGFDPTDVLVLVDGAPVADPDSGLADLARYSLDGVQRITITRGSSSLLYGPGALGGVIHLITGSPCAGGFGLLCAQAEAEASSELGSRLAAALGGDAGSLHAQLAASWERSPGFVLPAEFVPQRNEDGGQRANSDGEDLTVRGRGQWDLPLLALTAGASFVDHAGGVPCAVADPAPANLWRRGWRREAADLEGRLRRLGPLELTGKLYLARQLDTLTSYTDTSFEEVLDGGQAVSTHDGLRGGLFLAPRLRFPAARAELALGYHHQLDLAERQEERTAPWRRYRTETISLAGEARWRPWPRWTIFGGASAVAFFKEQAAQGATGEDLVDAEWLAGTLLALADGWLLRAGASQRVGFPTLKRLYGSYGNPDLRPQRALLGDLGLERAPAGPLLLGGELSLFADRVEDLIGKGGTANEMRYVNVARAALRGVELLLHCSPRHWTRLELGYSFLDARDLDRRDELATLDFHPAHTFDLGLALDLPWPGGSANLRYRLVSARAYLPQSSPTGGAGSPAQAEASKAQPRLVHLPWYGIIDLRLAQRFSLGATAAPELYLQASNLADTYREDAPGRPEPGRALALGLSGRI